MTLIGKGLQFIAWDLIYCFRLSSRLCPSTAGCSPPSLSSVCCFPNPGGSLLIYCLAQGKLKIVVAVLVVGPYSRRLNYTSWSSNWQWCANRGHCRVPEV